MRSLERFCKPREKFLPLSGDASASRDGVFCSFLPEPPAAGGGDVVVSAAGVDGCLDFSLAALWRNREEVFFFFSLLVSQCDVPLRSGNATRHQKKQPH